jgi:hypothetical protein
MTISSKFIDSFVKQRHQGSLHNYAYNKHSCHRKSYLCCFRINSIFSKRKFEFDQPSVSLGFVREIIISRRIH